MRSWEINLIRRAIRERWPIPEPLRLDTIRRLQEIIEGKVEADVRTVVNAVRALLAADSGNLRHEKQESDQEVREVLAKATAIIEELKRGDDAGASPGGAEGGGDTSGEPPPATPPLSGSAD